MMKSLAPLRRLRSLLMLAAALIFAGALGGCLRSRVHITSEPAGAEVIWRGKPYGATPVTIPFIWYWYYDFALEKPGYKRLDVQERFRTPPWFLMPLDIVMEIVPVPIPDNRYRHYVLEPAEKTEPLTSSPETVITPETLGLMKPKIKK